jgi:hypothetical protein
MSNMPSNKEIAEAWYRLICATKTGIFPFSEGDTVGWDEYHHYKFTNVGTVVKIITPHGPSGGDYCLEDGVYGLLRETKISNFRIEIRSKFLSCDNHISTTINGNNIHKIRSARMVLIEKAKKIDIYKQ